MDVGHESLGGIFLIKRSFGAAPPQIRRVGERTAVSASPWVIRNATKRQRTARSRYTARLKRSIATRTIAFGAGHAEYQVVAHDGLDDVVLGHKYQPRRFRTGPSERSNRWSLLTLLE
jgi:hypothetical protein